MVLLLLLLLVTPAECASIAARSTLLKKLRTAEFAGKLPSSKRSSVSALRLMKSSSCCCKLSMIVLSYVVTEHKQKMLYQMSPGAFGVVSTHLSPSATFARNVRRRYQRSKCKAVASIKFHNSLEFIFIDRQPATEHFA
jgi:hypothetical protein